MQHIEGSQLIGWFVLALIGFSFRLGLAFEKRQKIPSIWEVLFLGIFSFGFSALVFIWMLEKSWGVGLKMISICISSFFGSIVIRGLGSVEAKFIRSLFEDALRVMLKNWLNSSNTNNNINIDSNGYEYNKEDQENDSSEKTCE